MLLRLCYALCGTDLAYAATRFPRDIQTLVASYPYSPTPIPLFSYALARRCPVLTWAIILGGVWY
eukprot:2634132-Rhodomonas_salina.1